MLTYLHKLKKRNYIIQTVIMKATKETEKKGKSKKEETGVALQTGFITADVLVDKFKSIKDNLERLETSSKEIKVMSEDTLLIATNTMSEVMSHIKTVDSLRTDLKKPYLETGRMIDQYCKGIDDILQRCKLRFSSEITNYKTLKEAEERQKQAIRLKELEALEAEKTNEASLIIRIEKQLNARLYGGIYYTKTGERKSSSGCIKSEDCVTLHEVLNKNIPTVDTFKHFPERYEDMVRKVAKRLSEHQTNLLVVEGTSDYERKVAMERIAQARSEAEVESLDNQESITKQIDKEIRHEEIKTEKAVISAGKGIRQNLRWVVTDEMLVTRDFLSVDTDKLTKYMNENKEKIKEQLQQNEETLPGIRFFVSDTFVSR